MDPSQAFLFQDSKNNCTSCNCVKSKIKTQEVTSSSDSEGLDLRLTENVKTEESDSDDENT